MGNIKNKNITPKKKSRRKFLNLVIGSSFSVFLFSAIYPVLKFLIPPASREAKPKSVLAGKVEELEPNSGKIFRFGKKPGILINTQEGELIAFSATCTHLDCTVQYRKDFKHIWCACHNGHYDLRGINIQGPPPKPLTQFIVHIKDDQIFATRAG